MQNMFYTLNKHKLFVCEFIKSSKTVFQIKLYIKSFSTKNLHIFQVWITQKYYCQCLCYSQNPGNNLENVIWDHSHLDIFGLSFSLNLCMRIANSSVAWDLSSKSS